jgi:hypothetical protein
MTTSVFPTNARSTGDPLPPATALGIALCASFTANFAHAAPIAVNVTDITLSSTTPFALNINGGAPEYVFSRSQGDIIIIEFNDNVVDTQGNQVLGFVVAPPVEGGEITPVNGETKPGTYAHALAANDPIDSARFMSDGQSGSGILLSGISELKGSGAKTYGQFYDESLAYVGLRFDLGDGPRHGWVETSSLGEDLTITRFGYECVVNAPINAGAGTEGATCSLPPPGTGVPEPGTLALLVAGAVGVAALRRRQRARC